MAFFVYINIFLSRKARKVIIMIRYFSFVEALHLAKVCTLLNEVSLRSIEYKL